MDKKNIIRIGSLVLIVGFIIFMSWNICWSKSELNDESESRNSHNPVSSMDSVSNADITSHSNGNNLSSQSYFNDGYNDTELTMRIDDNYLEQDGVSYGVLKVEYDNESEDLYKIFYRCDDRLRLEDFKIKLKLLKSRDFLKANKISNVWNLSVGDKTTRGYFERHESSNSKTIQEMRRRGFKGFMTDLSELDSSCYKEFNVFLIIPGDKASGLKLNNDAGIDLNKLNGTTEVKSEIILDIEKLMDRNQYERFIYKMRYQKIENIFKQEGLYGLHLEFGEGLNPINTVKYNDFTRFCNYKNRVTAYDGMTVVHNFVPKRINYTIVTVLDRIKHSGLIREAINNCDYGSDMTCPKHVSVLLLSKDTELIEMLIATIQK